jgi:hypothetical protein
VDFLLAVGSYIIPIEVKSGATGTLKSLHLFLQSHPSTRYEREHRLHLNRAHRLHFHVDTCLPSVAQGLLSQRSA